MLSALAAGRTSTIMTITITDYTSSHQATIRSILEGIGWAEQYIVAAEKNAEAFSQIPDFFGVYLAMVEQTAIGFVYVQFYEWNRLAQIQGLAVDLSHQRQGVASQLVKRAEEFAQEKKARGIYVDTPTLNQKGRAFYEAIGYQFGYIMPRYYEDALDGVTYQKFF
ncbi:MAG: GNAT family N-acetyltransferase [Acidobacteria bacterium]|nr:GNAT family N-acetyltransferase [Acidobacteriota bacterium]